MYVSMMTSPVVTDLIKSRFHPNESVQLTEAGREEPAASGTGVCTSVCVRAGRVPVSVGGRR